MKIQFSRFSIFFQCRHTSSLAESCNRAANTTRKNNSSFNKQQRQGKVMTCYLCKIHQPSTFTCWRSSARQMWEGGLQKPAWIGALWKLRRPREGQEFIVWPKLLCFVRHQIFRIPSPLWQIHSNISWIMLSCSCLIFQIWKIGIIFKTSFHQQLGLMLLYIYSKTPKKREQVNFTTILLLDLVFSSMLSLFGIEIFYSHLK